MKLYSRTDLVEIFGVTRQAVSLWVRKEGFPAPLYTDQRGKSELWDEEAVKTIIEWRSK